jgi:hypothetical protein
MQKEKEKEKGYLAEPNMICKERKNIDSDLTKEKLWFQN